MLANGQHHFPPRAPQLVGDLGTGGGGPDHQDPAGIELRRIPVLHRGQRGDTRGQQIRHRRHHRHVAGTGRQNDGIAVPRTTIRDDLVAVTDAPDGRDRGARPYRCGRHVGVPDQEVDGLGHGAEPVGIFASIRETGQPALPVRRQQPQRVPAFGPPGVGHLAALEDHMVDRAPCQAPAHGQAGLASPDHDGRYPHCCPLLWDSRGVYLTSTVTLVGLVMMSYTAERFCDCATSALMSSGDASASMS